MPGASRDFLQTKPATEAAFEFKLDRGTFRTHATYILGRSSIESAHPHLSDDVLHRISKQAVRITINSTEIDKPTFAVERLCSNPICFGVQIGSQVFWRELESGKAITLGPGTKLQLFRDPTRQSPQIIVTLPDRLHAPKLRDSHHAIDTGLNFNSSRVLLDNNTFNQNLFSQDGSHAVRYGNYTSSRGAIRNILPESRASGSAAACCAMMLLDCGASKAYETLTGKQLHDAEDIVKCLRDHRIPAAKVRINSKNPLESLETLLKDHGPLILAMLHDHRDAFVILDEIKAADGITEPGKAWLRDPHKAQLVEVQSAELVQLCQGLAVVLE